jgi:hypothetical protein
LRIEPIVEPVWSAARPERLAPDLRQPHLP